MIVSYDTIIGSYFLNCLKKIFQNGHTPAKHRKLNQIPYVDRSKTKAHTAYQVGDLEMWRKRLKEYHFDIIESAPFPSAKAFEFRDPFGNRVEIIQKF